MPLQNHFKLSYRLRLDEFARTDGLLYNLAAFAFPSIEKIKRIEGDPAMKQNRRNFMKSTGVVCALATSGQLPAALAEAKLGATEARGMARGLTLLNIMLNSRRGAEYQIGRASCRERV